MKLLLHSNGPRSATGYGVQVALLADRLANDGHEVAISCNHGNDTGINMWQSPSGHKIRLYPRRISPTGADIIHGHANHFFEGDPRSGWIIPLIDVWAFRSPALAEFNVAAWAPVDHLDVPPGVLEFFSVTNAVPLAMSQHGRQRLTAAGLDPVFIPLAVDTKVYRPTPILEIEGQRIDAREFFEIPRQAFVVGMVAMNKGNVFDRKGFSEAFYGFAQFRRTHKDAVLFLHTDRAGFDGISLLELAKDAGIPEAALIFTNQYAYVIGFDAKTMAGMYTAMDVLLAPSHGEGFCVPLIEAQACGTPVIVSDATSQTELVGAGWLVEGQRMWDESQRSAAFMPSIDAIAQALADAYGSDLVGMQPQAMEFAQGFDADQVFDEFWRPFLSTLTPPAPSQDKAPLERLAVIVPVMQRPESVPALVKSFQANSPQFATLYLVTDPDDDAEREAIAPWLEFAGNVKMLTSTRGHTYAQKVNVGYAETDEDWLFVCGDDCEFTEGWVDAVLPLTTQFDVIGTNDSEEGRIRNPDVARGAHADHFFLRREYVEDEGSCLEPPGTCMPESYYHWFVDKEVIGLARARGVFAPCLDSRVIHHHPGYDGDEEARMGDPVYMKAVEWADRDRIQFMRRTPLIEQQRVARGRL